MVQHLTGGGGGKGGGGGGEGRKKLKLYFLRCKMLFYGGLSQGKIHKTMINS